MVRPFASDSVEVASEYRLKKSLLKAGALQSAIFNSANFSSIATDEKGVIQIFNVGAERMLGYAAADMVNKITPADISDPKEVIARAQALSIELETVITPGFEALVFKASRGIEDIYELTYIRKDGSRFPAVVSVTALRDAQAGIIGYLLIGTDNTARKRAEEALLKAGALQSAIFNSANFSSIATDAKGVIQIFNVGAERMLGYAAAEVVNKITPADISDPKEVIARAQALSVELDTVITPGFEALVFKASRGIEDIYELTYIRKDGSRFPAVVSVTALRDAHDAIIGYLLIGTDNTARKEIEQEQDILDQRLRDQQFYTRSLVESNIDALITTDPTGIITDVNKQMEILTGCTRDELIGAPFKDSFTDPARAEAGIKRVLHERRVTDYELTARAIDGKETIVSYNATTFYDRKRKLQGVFAAARDVTDRKRADDLTAQALSELNYVKAAIDEHAIVAVTDTKGKIIYVNDKFCKISRFTRDELLGQDHRIVNSGFHSKEFIRSLWKTISEGRVWKGEIKNRAKDGTTYWVDTTIVPYMGEDGKPLRYIAIRTDITERKMFEQSLQETNVKLDSAKSLAEKANVSKSHFLSNMSHELRTPLNAILGLSEALLEQVSGPLNPRQVKSISTISTSGAHLLMLINDILDLSKVESGNLELNLETVIIREFCESCLLFVRTQAMQKNIDVAFELGSCVGQFSADPRRLKQILVNLLTNAVKFTPKGGRIGLTVAAPEGDDTLSFSVWDTGIGISRENESKLFRAFTQIDSSLSRVQEGTGLGLVLVAKLVELHGGSVSLESEPGKGSRFTVTLPRFTTPTPKPAPTSIQDRTGYRRALIIEDDPVSAGILMGYLTELGLESVLHVRGEESVETALRERPDVILLDIQLPSESGWVVLVRLKENRATRDIPVVVVSVIDEPGKARVLGASAHFTKPITRAQLAGFLQREEVALFPAVRPSSAPFSPAGPSILLAEDNEANILTIGGYLEDKGCKMSYAGNGLLAVKLARELRPELILMDIQMPMMDGLAAIREIRSDSAIAGIPIVALTALAMPGDRERCLAAGATDYMSKPVNLKTLTELMARLLASGETVRL
jgi:PAS domain S-box-containing protein